MTTQLDTIHSEIIDALRPVAINSAYNASRALSKWFHRGVRLTCDGFRLVSLSEAADALGAPDDAVIAVHMPLEGELGGDILLAFPEEVALSLVDVLMMQPPGTTTTLGELEQSGLQETGNIVGSALANSLSNWLKLPTAPGAPEVRHDLAGAVIEPLLVRQAVDGDDILVAHTEFELDGARKDFRLLLLPAVESLAAMRARGESDRVKQNALHTIAINGAFDASRAMSKWLRRGVRLSTEGFVRVPLRQVVEGFADERPVVAMHTSLCQQLHGHALIVLSMDTAHTLVALLTGADAEEGDSLSEMSRSALQETGNIVSSAFVNSWARWLDLHSEPSTPAVVVDLPAAILESVVVEQAQVGDEVFMSKAQFSLDGNWLEWDLYLLPTPSSLRLIEASCE